MILLGPCNFTFVNFKQRPTTPTLSHATPTHALHVKGCFSLIAKFMLYMCQRPLNVSTSFRVRAAPKSWSKYTTHVAVFQLGQVHFYFQGI